MASPALFKVVLNSKPGAFQFDLELTPRKPMDKATPIKAITKLRSRLPSTKKKAAEPGGPVRGTVIDRIAGPRKE